MATEKNKRESESAGMNGIPWAVVLWGIISIFIGLISLQEVTLQDTERFPPDFEVRSESAADTNNQVTIYLTDGTFEYNVIPEVSTEVETGTFDADTNHPVASRLFSDIPDVTTVTIESQSIRITYDNEDIEPDIMLQRAQRPVRNAVLNNQETIERQISSEDEQILVFTTTDPTWLFGQYTPALLEAGQQETYDSREEAQSGSPLAQYIVNQVSAIEQLSLYPDRIIATYRDGAVENQVVERVQRALNDFHPRASLQPHLWLMTVIFSSDTVLDVRPVDTGLPLLIYSIAFVIIELILFIGYRNRANKVIKPIIRTLGIFFLFWSFYGHEPLWDYLLSLLFPTSAQLVHPSATVIEFTAQHLELVFVSSLITIPIGLLVGIVVTRDQFREILPLVNNIVNSGQTVPTIAVVAFMAPIIGFGFWPAIIALVIYGLLPVVRNTIAGLEAVDPFVIDSARGMGLTASQILLQIELPIAISVIMAGIRTSMVINVGTATLGAFVGSGGLGTPIASGLAMTIDAFIVLGAIPAAILAILIDFVLSRVEFVLTPSGLQIDS